MPQRPGVVGWCDGRASYNLDIIGQGPIALAVGAGGGCLDIFTLLCIFSSLSPSLWETARYRLKYCLKGPLNPEQPIKGWSGGAMVLGKLPVPGRPTIWGVVGWCEGAG